MAHTIRAALSITIILLSIFDQLALAHIDLGWDTWSDEDLTNFVTRPDLKLPRFNVTIHDHDRLTPGYWFVGTYVDIEQKSIADNYYQACQSGPAIYDQEGDLVWSGACRFQNQNALDFRTWRANDTDFLSAIFWIWKDVDDKKGHGVILDDSYNVVSELHVPRTMNFFNMHELNIIDEGKRAIYITARTVIVDFEAHNLDFDVDIGLIQDLGFHEIDMVTGDVIFEWWASDHISPNESTAVVRNLAGPWPIGWNWIHLNSVDKSPEGDYLVCSRYTNAIYKVSGENGSLLWTLGGINSNFQLEEGFNFSRQHDARFLDQDGEKEIITFLDNGGDGNYSTSDVSSSLVVSLDKSDWQAKVVKRWQRPGGRLTAARGNFQLLPSGNAFTGWSDNAHISEHTWDGDLIMEAEFSSKRMVTYRTYKSNFTGHPDTLPDIKAFVFGKTPETGTTVVYVSWNGATEVETWKFYREVDGKEIFLASKARTGFETSLQVGGFESKVLAKGISADGLVLSSSSTFTTIVPADWTDLKTEKTETRGNKSLAKQMSGEDSTYEEDIIGRPPLQDDLAEEQSLLEMIRKTEL